MVPASPEVNNLMQEYQYALNDGLGKGAYDYTLISVANLNDMTNVGIAHQVTSQSMYLLVDGTDGAHSLANMSFFLLDTAKELTAFYRTLVVPDQSSRGQIFWGGKQRGPIIAYRFKLADSPDSLRS